MVGVPGADDGLGAEDVRDEVAADPRVLHLKRHVQLRAAVPRRCLHRTAVLAASRRATDAGDAVAALGPRRPHG